MTEKSRDEDSLDITLLPSDLRAIFTKILNGHDISIVERGKILGSLAFKPRVFVGSLISPILEAEQTLQRPQGELCVVATAMRLSDTARSRLSSDLGRDYIVLDLTAAPSSADVILTQPISPQLLNKLKVDFPDAQIIVTEIEDEEAKVSCTGPVSRLLNAGATAYLPPCSLDQVAPLIRTHLEQDARQALKASSLKHPCELEIEHASSCSGTVQHVDIWPRITE